MKKLLFVVAASFFSGAVYAQTETSATQYADFGPKELKCTEEAISFRLSILPGGQLSAFRWGYVDYANAASGFTSSKNYAGGENIAEPVQLIEYENALNLQDTYPNKNFLLPEKTINPLMQISPFANGHFFYNYYNLLQSSNFNFLAPR